MVRPGVLDEDNPPSLADLEEPAADTDLPGQPGPDAVFPETVVVPADLTLVGHMCHLLLLEVHIGTAGSQIERSFSFARNDYSPVS